MELYENVEQKKSKVPMILGICIAVLVVLTILIVVAIVYLQSTITTIQINGQRNATIEEILHFEHTEKGVEIYAPILKMTQFFGYEGYIGDYKNKSEDSSKCHVTCEGETAMFTSGSNILIKISEDEELEYVTLDKEVFEKDGELYTTIDGIQNAFNILFSSDEEFKNIKLYTMDYLLQTYATNLQLEEYSTEFVDKKAILEGKIIVEQNKQVGVLDVVNKQYVLEPKYESITYLPATSDFLVKSNGKYGVMTNDATVKISTIYDEIKTMDNLKGLYSVKKNNAYGVVNTDGQVIIEPEYKKIGIDMKKYAQNGVENPYILLDEIIPLQNSEGLWGLFNIKGEKVADFKYTGIGCQDLPVSNSYPTVVIPSYKIIVVQADKNYNIVSTSGEEIIPGNLLNSVYIKLDVTTKQNKYYMTSSNNTKTVNAEEWLASIGR